MRRLLSGVCVLALILGITVAPASAAERAERPSAERPSGEFTPFEGGGSSTKSAPPASVQALLAGDDAFPGVYRDWSNAPFNDTVDWATDAKDIYPIYLEYGEQLELELTGSVGDFDLYLYYPNETEAAYSEAAGSNEQIRGTATYPGTWYVIVQAYSGSGAYTLDAAFASPEDNIFWYQGFTTPTLPASPVAEHLDSFSDWDDVYKVWLNTGDTVHVTLTTANSTAGFGPDLYVYEPDATDVYADQWAADTEGQAYPKSLTYVATQPGYHYLDVFDAPTDHNYGDTTLTYSIDRVPLLPVYRFYNVRLGTHFYTASEAEKNNVIATLGNVFTFEGTAYVVNPAQNSTPLYRFYNRRTGTHFYTASEAEKSNVIATLGAIFTFEGVAYNVSGAPGVGTTAVYRFYNVRTGTHFYTATEAERDNVIATLGNVYQYEGVGFWYGL